MSDERELRRRRLAADRAVPNRDWMVNPMQADSELRKRGAEERIDARRSSSLADSPYARALARLSKRAL
jgi:hypothetical protein